MNHPIQLSTKRLILRKPQATDVSTIIKHIDNPKIAEMTGNIPYPYFEDSAIFWINMANEGLKNKDKYVFAIVHQADNELIGGIGLHLIEPHNRAELGYWLSENYWNQGLVTEALEKVLDFGFNTLKLHKIHAIHFAHNPASGSVMTKNGMEKEGMLKQHIRKGETYFDLIQYGILHPSLRK